MNDIGRFLWLSDVHMDPYYGTPQANGHNNCTEESAPPCGRIGCDAPESLVESATSAIHKAFAAQGIPDFVLITGDWVRHKMNLLEAPETIYPQILQTISAMLSSNLSTDGNRTASVIPTVGNNDFIPDYYLDVDDAVPALELFGNALDDWFLSDEERSTFRRGGYLERHVSQSLTVLSINTVMYSMRHSPPSLDNNDPLGQFQWLRQRLQEARDAGRHVYIVGHIPPALGSHEHEQFWENKYLTIYYQIIEPYSEAVIAAQLFGHLHSDEIRWTQGRWPLLLTSSMTPIYGCNPSFRFVDFDQVTGIPQDYHTYYLPVSNIASECLSDAWVRGPSFRDSFGLVDLSPAAFQNWIQELESNLDVPEDSHWNALLSRHFVYSQGTLAGKDCLDVECRRQWLCSMTKTDSESYDVCFVGSVPPGRNQFQKDSWSKGKILWVAILAGCALLSVIVLAVVIRRWHRRRHYKAHVDKEAHDAHDLHQVKTEIALPPLPEIH